MPKALMPFVFMKRELAFDVAFAALASGANIHAA